MTALVLGPNGSGKSAYAEKLACAMCGSLPRGGDGLCAFAGKPAVPPVRRALYYIATMVPYGEEGRARVERHRVSRADAGFITVERAFQVSGINLPPESVVLLEDVSNLLSNAMFDGNKFEEKNDVERLCGSEISVFADIKRLCGQTRGAVLVSIGGLAVSPDYNEETNDYIGGLNRLNDRLADFADTVINMQGGAPVCVKGDIYALD